MLFVIINTGINATEVIWIEVSTFPMVASTNLSISVNNPTEVGVQVALKEVVDPGVRVRGKPGSPDKPKGAPPTIEMELIVAFTVPTFFTTTPTGVAVWVEIVFPNTTGLGITDNAIVPPVGDEPVIGAE